MAIKHYQKLLDVPDLEIPKPSRIAVVGFIITFGVCLAMFLGMVMLSRWLRG